MNDVANKCEFLAAQMADHEANWSLGTFGAIAEFMRDADEPVALSNGDACVTAVTARGGIRIEPREPQAGCAMNGRTVLTALGPDIQALREEDRQATLFDLGLGALQVDVCIRVADPKVTAELLSHAGRPLFEPGNPAMSVILASSPHRVFASRLGRIEVFQPIPPPEGQSPEGPHTHVLPKLLQHRRTHSATEPVPIGWIPCVHLYPPHPMKDGSGHARAFDLGRHEAFQEMLRRFGDPELVSLKQRVVAAVAAGGDPSTVPVIDNRFARANIRVVLRQLNAADEALPALAAWMAAHERPDRIESDDEPHRHD